VKPNPGEVLRGCATPVIAAVNGPCITGGLEMALSCTFILASERATFRDTHARLGLMPGWGLSALLPRAVGGRVAAEMTLTGRPLDATGAYAAGLVNRLCPHDELLVEALGAARLIAEAEPRVVRAALGLYRRGEGVSLEQALAFEQEAADAWRADASQSRAGFERLKGR
jgi:enoyl-CoA hydratase